MILIYLGVGTISSEARGLSQLKIGNIKDLQHVLVPFLLSYPILGFKGLQFNLWLKALEIKLCYGSTKNNYSKDQENKVKDILKKAPVTELGPRKLEFIYFCLLLINPHPVSLALPSAIRSWLLRSKAGPFFLYI